jgi:hypothetical protein
MSEKVDYTRAEWLAEAERRFGKDPMSWTFVCPSCGHVQSVADYKAAGAPSTACAFSCVGRWLPKEKTGEGFGKPGPCNYTGGGLIHLNPVRVTSPEGDVIEAFEFAEPKITVPATSEAGKDIGGEAPDAKISEAP